ncbi:MAG: metallophosphoesterase family protein [Desulfobacteraceae bacterium]
MRIYAAADIHSKSERMERIESVIEKFRPDLFVAAGDITSFFNYKETLSRLNRLPVPVFAVLGNSDFKTAGQRLNRDHGKFLLKDTPLSFQGHEFLGTGGTVPLPFLSKVCLLEKRRLNRLAEHLNGKSILVVHPPPRKILDRVAGKFHAGSAALKNFIKKHPPGVLICGHIHEDPGFVETPHTLVVNCAMNRSSSGALIDLHEDPPHSVTLMTRDSSLP